MSLASHRLFFEKSQAAMPALKVKLAALIANSSGQVKELLYIKMPVAEGNGTGGTTPDN